MKIFSKQKIDDIEKEKRIPDEWYVGKYIEKVLNKNDERTEYLIDIVNGLMIYIGVYETNDYFQECTQKFKGTDFYLDTKLGCCIKSGIDWSVGNNQTYNLNDEELKKFIRLKHPKWKERAIDNDINTVNCINVLRKGNYTVKYGGKKKLPLRR